MNADILRAFLDDCKTAPDDDAPRLILADWLEDHAGVEAVHDRGTLLRLQCEAARLPEHDPNAVAMRRQAGELIARHEHLWLGDLAELPAVETRFVRGMIHVTLAGTDLATPASLDASPMSWGWVESATVLAAYGELPALAETPLLRHFPRLELCQQRSYSEWTKLLDAEHLTRLVDLDVLHAGGTDRDVAELCRRPVLSRLRRLALRLGEVNPTGWRPFARCPALAGLEALAVTRCDARGVGFRDLAASPHLGRLRGLDVSYNRIDGKALRALSGAAFAGRLERLSLAGNDLGDVAGLADAPLTGLRQLDLGGCGLDDAAVAALADADWLPTLREVDLRGATLTASGPGFLAATLRSVEVLRLGSCGLTPEGLAALASSPHLGRLRELHLRDNLVGDAGVAELVRGDLPGLRVLALDATRLTDDALRRLADWPGLAELWFLSLTGNTFTEVGLRALAESYYRSPRTRVVVA